MKAVLEKGVSITLLDKFEIKRGGEGKILTIPELPNHVAKIYLVKNYQHMSKAQKDALDVLDPQLFVKPQELIFDPKSKDLIGFTMEYIQADFIPLSTFFNKNFCASNQLDDLFKTKLAKTLIKAVHSAHQEEIIIGDLSGLNILADLKGQVKFLDVDSYETPVHSHWGLLFDEIRDYLYQGKVSKESDYFALAVLIFSLFTNLHPFKGIHKTYRSMAERMIQKIPVFANDPELIIPKCYTPVQNQEIQKQFEDIFLLGKRYLINIDQQIQTKAIKTLAPVVLQQAQLTLKEIYKLEPGEVIRKAFFTSQLGYIATNQRFLLYDASNKGYLLQKNSISAKEAEEVFTGDRNTLIKVGNELKILTEDRGFASLTNFQFRENARFHQINNILIVLEEDYMRFLYLDEVIKEMIKIEQTPVFGRGFDVFNGFIQNTGGMQYLFYHSGKTISTLKSSLQLQSVYINGNTGWACYEEKTNGESILKYEYFGIRNLQMKNSGQFLFHAKHFAFKPTQNQEGIVFEPADDKLLLRRTEDFQIIQEMDCNLMSVDTHLFNTQAGIIALESGFCFLLNSKA